MVSTDPMPEHVSLYQLAGMAVLALASVVWAVALTRVLRRTREAGREGFAPTLPGSVRPRRLGPDLEAAPLTPAERAAFAGLVRQFGDDR